MKKFTAFLAIVTMITSADGQQLPYHSQYMFNDMLLNPAAAGTKEYIPIMLTFRNQWTNFTDAPKTFTLSAHKAIAKKKIGIGAIIFSDNTGPLSRTGLDMDYSYHLKVGKDKLAFGLSVMFFQYKLDKSKLTTDPEGGFDPAINGGETVSQFVPEGTFGIYYYGKNYYAGFSAPQLIQYRVNVGATSLNRMVRHYFLTGGYLFEINDKFDIEPSLLFKVVAAAPLQLDINARGYYNKMVWLGISYRTEESLVILIGVKKSGFGFGYSYDVTLTNIKKYSTGSHEILLSYDISSEQKGKALID